VQTLTNWQIDDLEGSLGVRLPGLYRKLLVEIGHGLLPLGGQIYHPSEICPLYEPIFDDPDRLFNPYFPFGCDNRREEIWIIDADRELAASIRHETAPDDWAGESWLEYHEWVIKYLDRELQDVDGAE
jgi:hypothetical protein